MAESESIDCPCSNIAIMQLFHELKQSYPTVPDQIVSKVIQENYHDKSACETILRKESHAYLQSYPGAIISGNQRESPERGSLCSHCPAARGSRQGSECAAPGEVTPPRQENAFSSSEEGSIYGGGRGRGKDSKPRRGPSPEEAGRGSERVEDSGRGRGRRGGVAGSASETSTEGFESSSANSTTTLFSECDSDKSEPSRVPRGEGETVSWSVEDGGRSSGGSSGVAAASCRGPSGGEEKKIEFQVAVQYSMQPALPLRQGDRQRSFTSVNLSLRPPSSEPQPPIEIQSGQNLTYTTSVFDAKKGVQSQLQIRIGPGGGGTVSACRTYVSSPQTRYSCGSPYCTSQFSAGFRCQNNHRLKALLEEQRERKDLLARELRREKEKLRCMQNEVRLMKASIAQRPSPHLLPKLKAEIERLRAECERLTAAVDLYSDSQNNLPLGETDEEFYRNIYTGQRLQREGSWSCQLCTFRNHPLLSVCEECEMPRISLGRRDIHIRVTHHCPPSRTVNSWVV